MCPANICASPVRLVHTAGKISTCPDWKFTCPVGHVATKVYVPWDKIYMPRARGHTLMSSPGKDSVITTPIVYKKGAINLLFLARGLTDVSTAGFSIRCVKTVSVRLCDVCQTYISSFNSAPITTRLRWTWSGQGPLKHDWAKFFISDVES